MGINVAVYPEKKKHMAYIFSFFWINYSFRLFLLAPIEAKTALAVAAESGKTGQYL